MPNDDRGTKFDPLWDGPVGVDVSNHQGEVNWHKLRKRGVSFAWVKSTEGYGWTDPRAYENVLRARDAGVLVGLYHFARADSRHALGVASDAEHEALWFVEAHRRAGLLVGDHEVLADGVLPPALDIEWGGAKGVSKDEVTLWCRMFCDRVWRELGVPPIIYTGPNFAKFRLDQDERTDAWDPDKLATYALWMARYNKGDKPSKEVPGWPWLVWQHSGKWPRPDAPGKVIDANRFVGTMGDLREFAGLPRTEEDRSSWPWWLRWSVGLFGRYKIR